MVLNNATTDQMHWMRACFRQLSGADPAPLFVDILLDGNRRIARFPYAGWWGVPRTNHWVRPILFRLDGLADFGGDPETRDAERYSKMSIHDRIFDLGERFYMSDLEGGAVYEFELLELKDLSELAKIQV